MTELLTQHGETSSTDDTKDSAESLSTSKNKSKTVAKAGNLTAEKMIGAVEAPKKAETLWQRWTREKAEKKTSPNTETNHEDVKTGEKLPLDSLSRAETYAVAQDYIDTRTEALQTELALESHEKESSDAETQANLALLQVMNEKLAVDPERPIELSLDEAESETVVWLNGEHHEPEAPEAASVDGDDVESHQGATDAETDEDDEDEDPATAGSSGSGGAKKRPPIVTPPVPPPPLPVPGRKHNVIIPPVPVLYPPTPTPATHNVIPPHYISTTEALRNERRAIGQGLLVGGIVGYFLGRRRGRIKSEQKLIPIQEKLEKEVQGLHDLIADKEQRIRSLAAERAAIEQRELVALQHVPEIVTPTQEARFEPVRPTPTIQRERLGKMLVEAPGVSEVDTIGSQEISLHTKEMPIVIPFDKKVEAFSSQELSEAAEKIVIDGVNLKEMYNAKRINEAGMRRVVAEFLRGGNMREALNRELHDKELSYERDPKMRQAAGASQGGDTSGGGSAGAAADSTGGASTADDRPASAFTTGAASTVDPLKRPVPDEKTIRTLRNRQLANVATTTVAIGAIVAILIMFLA